MTQVISLTERPLSLSANPTNICASVDTNVGTRRTEEPFWRRILPSSISLRRVRWSRGSDPRLLRLTMDGVLDRHIGERPRAIKHRPRPKVRPAHAKT